MRTAVLHLPLPYLYCPIASPPIYFIFFLFPVFLLRLFFLPFRFFHIFLPVFSWWQVTRGMSGNVTSAGWQVTRCDLIWHVSSHSGESSCKLLYPVFLYFIFTFSVLLTSRLCHFSSPSLSYFFVLSLFLFLSFTFSLLEGHVPSML